MTADNMQNSGVGQDGSRHILVAEDSKAQFQVLKSILVRNGYHITHVQDGVDGLSALDHCIPDLIISDIWMPRMNGYEFCQILKKTEKFRSIPVILLTSLSDLKDLIQGLEVGADYYITKPFNEELLLSELKVIFSDTGACSAHTESVAVNVKTPELSHPATLNPQNILNFLVSTFGNFRAQNTFLLKTKQELKNLNETLESRVKEKTDVLSREIIERKKAEAAANQSLIVAKKNLDCLVNALAKTLELRDPYTAGHQRRVAHLACAIAKEMSFSDEDLEGMQVMGFLHDLGKIVVPAEILSKPGKLSEVEFNMIKVHSEVGYDILKDIEFPWPVSIAVLQHHERMNGAGYPRKLVKDDIILEARIIAVADVVESMASHRPYRPALGIDCALAEISKNSGILYDTSVADICRDLFETKGFRLEE